VSLSQHRKMNFTVCGHMLTGEMRTFTHAYNQTQSTDVCSLFSSSFSLFISILYNVLQNLSLTHDVHILSGTDAQT